MKQFLLTLGIAAATLFGSLSSYAYEVSFKTNTSDSSSELTSNNFSKQIETGSNYITFSSCSKVYAGKSGLKFSSTKAAGSLTLNMTENGKIKASAITITTAAFNTDITTWSIAINGATTNTDFKSVDGVLTYTLADPEVITSIKISSSKRAYLTSINVINADAPEKCELFQDNLVVTDGNDQTLNDGESYEYAAPTKISFAYTGDTGVANPDITYSYSVDGAPAVEGNEYTYEADKDVTLTVNAISSNTVSKTINLNKQWPTECPLPVFNLENNAEVQQGQTISVSCEGAKSLIWTVNDTDIEGTSYTVTEAPGTTLTFHALASVDGKTGELTAENSITVKVVEATSATFDFANNNYGLTPQTDSNKFEPDMENPVTAINSGIATIKFEGAKYRYWDNDKTLRVQTGSSFTISVPDKYYITSVAMTGTCASNVDSGTFTNKNWTPGENNVASIKFSPTATTKIDTITVNYAVDTTSGISDVMVDGNDSAEYFNLQGLRVAQPEAGQIYIRVQNGKASKLRF